MGGCLDDDIGNNIFTTSNWKTLKAVLAEFLGTALLCFLGVASCLNWTHTTDHDQLIRIGLTFGFALAGIVYMFGPISGAHVNPAVTIACLVVGRIKMVPAFLYIIAQCSGAISGCGILYLLQQEDFGAEKTHQFGLTKVNPDLRADQGLFTEMLTTMILVLVVLLVTHEGWNDHCSGTVGVAIGLTLCTLELGFVNATGGSMNPARTLGPAFILMDFSGMWIYWLGPIAGAVIAVIFYKIFTWDPKPKATTSDVDAQTLPTTVSEANNTNGNAVFVSSDINSATSYDEILIEDDANRLKK